MALRTPDDVKTLAHLGALIDSAPSDRLYLIRLHDNVKTIDAALDLSQNPAVLFASPDWPTRDTALPNDPNFNGQLGIQRADVDDAWNIWRPVEPTFVAISDTGVDTAHPELTNKIRRENGQIVAYKDRITDAGKHGTQVAGILAAQTNNATMIAGVAGWTGTPGSDTEFTKIMLVGSRPGNGSGSVMKDAKGILWAAHNGAHVLNMSWTTSYSNEYGIPQWADVGSWDDEAPLEAAIWEAWRHDLIMIGSAGNNSGDSPRAPAKLRGVLAVGATNLQDDLLGSSNHGSWVDVLAPGINSTLLPGNGYDPDFRGTSSAAPIVAGAAALIRSHNPNLNDVYIRYLLRTNVDPYQGPSIRQGGGRINVRRALEAAATPRIRLTITPDVTEGGQPKPVGTITMDPPPSHLLGQVLQLETFEPSHIHLPPTINVPQSGTRSFDIEIVSIPENPKTTIIVRGGGGVAATTLWVYPILYGLLDVLADQKTLRYGKQMAMDMVLDSLPRTDVAVTMTSTHPDILRVPAQIYLAAGVGRRTLTLQAGRVSAPLFVTLTATVKGGATKSIVVRVVP